MSPAATWFVAFLPARALERQAWWLRGLHRGYAHAVLCAGTAQNTTWLLDHRGTRLHVHLLPMAVAAFLRHLQDQAAAWVLAVPQAGAPGPDRALARGPMSCVETIKAALGIRAPWVLTPRQLARHLRRRLGARPVLPLTDR